MTTAADVRVVIDALAGRFGGAAYASIEIAERLADHPAVDEVVVVARRGSIVSEQLIQRTGLALVELPAARRLELARRLAWEATALPALMRDDNSVLLTWSGMLPRHVRGRVVCYLANPILFQDKGAGNRVRRWATRRTARTAAHVIAPSAHMAEIAASRLGRIPEVVPLGIDHARFRPATAPGTEVLVLADPYPHKRHDLAIATWAALPVPRPVLRLVGDPRVHPAHSRVIDALVERFRGHGTIVRESGLGAQTLLSAFHRAGVLLLTSERESFALPMAEALACGVPVLARDLPALRETGGDAGTYMVGDDAAAWAAELRRLLHDDEAQARARTAGLAQAARFDWARTAAALIERMTRP